MTERKSVSDLDPLQIRALNAIKNGVVILDGQKSILWANSALLDLAGYSLDEIIGKALYILDSGRDPHEHNAKYLGGFLSEKFWQDNLSIRSKDGSLHQFKLTISPIKDDLDHNPSFVAVMEDITNQLQTERRLKEAERIAQLGHWELDIQANQLYWSDEIYRIFEIPLSEFKASYEAFLDMVYPDDRKLVDKTYTESLRIRKPFSIDHRILLKDGRIKFVQEQCETFFDEQGVAIRSIGTVQDITERNHAEEQLRKLSRAVESASMSVVITSKNGTIEYTNPFFSSVTGYDKDEVIGKNPRILQSDKTPPATYSLLWETILAGRGWQGEFINKKKNGELYIEAAQISPIFDAEGQITHFVATKQDITERKQIEEKLLENEERYRFITQNADDIIWTMDMELRFTFVSPAMERAFGYPTTELMTLSPEQLLMPDSYASGLKAFAEEVGNALPQPDPTYARILELECCRKDGSTFWIEAKFTFFRDMDGQLIGFLGVGRDITDRKRADEELRASEARYRSLFEQTHDAVFILDLEGHHLAANQRAADMLGYTKDELATLSMNQTSAEIDQSKSVIVRLLAGESIPLYERLFRKKKGEVFPVEINVELVRDKNGEPLHIQSVVRDITERKRMENELRRREREFSSLVENTNDLIARFDTDLRYIFCNKEFERRGSRPISAYLGRTILDVGARNRESVVALDQAALKVLETGDVQQVEHDLLTTSGFRHYQTRVFPEYDETGHIVSLFSMGRDITEHKQLENALKEAKDIAEKQATGDELTGLYNRRGFFELCRREVGRLQRYGRPLSLLFIDIDYFKQFNDRHSYEVGDRVLQEVATTLQRNLREIDIVGRYGGEEMIALLPEIDQDRAIETAERLRKAVETLRVPSRKEELMVTVSIGSTTLNRVQNQTIARGIEKQTAVLENLIAQAGQALHVAKHNGRNQVAVYNEIN